MILADSGQRGLEVCRRARPDVVLLDLKIPGMYGLSVSQQIHHLNPTQPVIILTGAGTPELEQQVRELEGDRVRGKTVLAASAEGRADSSARDAPSCTVTQRVLTSYPTASVVVFAPAFEHARLLSLEAHPFDRFL